MNVRDDPTTRNCRLDEGIEFFVTTNGQLQVPRRNTLDLQVLASIASQLEDFGREVLQDGGSVDSSSGSHAMPLVNGVFEETVDATDGKLETGLGRARLRRFLGGRGLAALSSFATFASFSRLFD